MIILYHFILYIYYYIKFSILYLIYMNYNKQHININHVYLTDVIHNVYKDILMYTFVNIYYTCNIKIYIMLILYV